MKILILLLCAASLNFFALESCKNSSDAKNKLNQAATVIYHFGDSSVPPQYHRSYTITVSKTEAHILVDSYDTPVAEKRIKISEKQFDEITGAIEKAAISKRAPKQNDGCTGGTSDGLKILKADQAVIFDGSVYHCGADDYGELSGDIAAVKSKFVRLFPNFEEKLK